MANSILLGNNYSFFPIKPELEGKQWIIRQRI